MALIKYKVLESDCRDGEAYIPENATLIGINSDLAGRPSVIFVMKYADWVDAFPEDVKKEEAKREEVSKKGTDNAE